MSFKPTGFSQNTTHSLTEPADHMILEKPDIVYYPAFFEAIEANEIFTTLLAELNFKSDEVKVFNKVYLTKRLTDFRADPGCVYHYSGFTKPDNPWTPCLAAIRSRINAFFQHEFNACLCNFYPDGQSAMGWHSDNERELGSSPHIVSISLGGERNFGMRLKSQWRTELTPKIAYSLKNGDVLLMKGDTQTYWEHQIASTKKHVAPRINLTFRKVYR